MQIYIFFVVKRWITKIHKNKRHVWASIMAQPSRSTSSVQNARSVQETEKWESPSPAFVDSFPVPSSGHRRAAGVGRRRVQGILLVSSIPPFLLHLSALDSSPVNLRGRNGSDIPVPFSLPHVVDFFVDCIVLCGLEICEEAASSVLDKNQTWWIIIIVYKF